MFPDSKIAEYFSGQQKKISYVIFHGINSHFRRQLIDDVQINEKKEIFSFQFFFSHHVGTLRLINPMRRLFQHIYRRFTLLLVEDISSENQLINVELREDIDANGSIEDKKWFEFSLMLDIGFESNIFFFPLDITYRLYFKFNFIDLVLSQICFKYQ